ncbi:MAG TPA: hypothetical protein PKW90_14115, partial [Myxococcota bacterium]|nr:hypothetical protein [Myxococcota bacterium]
SFVFSSDIKDDGAGNIAGPSGTVGTIDYATGAVTLNYRPGTGTGIYGGLVTFTPAVQVSTQSHTLGVPITLATRGPMQVLAWFPADAVGQLAAGQPGSLSLAARPDTWFRPVPLQLLAVGAGEDARGVRVLLTPQEDVDLLHGMTGRVRVQVEASVPAALVLRSLGGG